MLEDYLNTVNCMDCLALMDALPPQSVDAIITDLPYGMTACSWDTIIPFEPMWKGVKRILKPRGVFVTTASQPFTSALVMSNPKWFKCEWIWNKTIAANIGNVHYMPLKIHDNIVVFSEGANDYFPILTESDYVRFGKKTATSSKVYGRTFGTDYQENVGYPKSILEFTRPYNLTDGGKHPTQKPVALYEYLIRTYTRENDIVLDFCAGSGTTGLAARNCGRRYILGDTSPEYCAIAEDRLRLPFEPKAVKADNNVSDLPLFAALDTSGA